MALVPQNHVVNGFDPNMCGPRVWPREASQANQVSSLPLEPDGNSTKLPIIGGARLGGGVCKKLRPEPVRPFFSLLLTRNDVVQF